MDLDMHVCRQVAGIQDFPFTFSPSLYVSLDERRLLVRRKEKTNLCPVVCLLSVPMEQNLAAVR